MSIPKDESATISFQEWLRLKMQRDLLRDALGRLVQAHEDIQSDSDGRYPSLDGGCIECTVGTVPNDRNRGLCALHFAKDVLRTHVVSNATFFSISL